eukprot:365679-Chlamydomonas_euryale.AAC.13
MVFQRKHTCRAGCLHLSNCAHERLDRAQRAACQAHMKHSTFTGKQKAKRGSALAPQPCPKVPFFFPVLAYTRNVSPWRASPFIASIKAPPGHTSLSAAPLPAQA